MRRSGKATLNHIPPFFVKKLDKSNHVFHLLHFDGRLGWMVIGHNKQDIRLASGFARTLLYTPHTSWHGDGRRTQAHSLQKITSIHYLHH